MKHLEEQKLEQELSIICRVDETTYYSGRLTNQLRSYRNQAGDLQFFDAKCNWTRNAETARFYHILAEEQSQAEMLAVKEYANEFHISQNYVDVVSSNL